MKPLPDTPGLESLSQLTHERVQVVLNALSKLSDVDYLHWEKLRHLSPPLDLNAMEWWLALKLKRAGAHVRFPLLTSIKQRELSIARHARIDAGVARMDRLLAGRLALPPEVKNTASRDQFIASSLMEEAIHSSLFEGAVSTREVAKEMLRSERAPTTRDERMIANNYRAMLRIREMARAPLTLSAVLELHRIVTEDTLDKPDGAGRLQTVDEERIAIVDMRLNRIAHRPPPAEQLEKRMERLLEFANAEDTEGDQYVHPVVRSILLHFQLAYDHPFCDGNGRTARALFYWSMLRRGYWLTEFLSISRPLLRSRGAYELAFQQVESDHQDSTYFVLQQLNVLQQVVDEMFAYVERKSAAQQTLRGRLANRGDLNHRQLALLGHALRKPDAIYTHESHANSHRVSTITARADLRKLVDRGWLRQLRSGRQHIYQPAPDLESMLA